MGPPWQGIPSERHCTAESGSVKDRVDRGDVGTPAGAAEGRVAVGAGMRLCVLGIALAGFLLPPAGAVVAICGLLMLFGFSMGMQGVIFSFLMSVTR